ncbi:YT521-B-like domain-containing protein [Mycena leptocephala]|nr:YT521-B-like domain-containing protein [Mycena leptocephala]
MSGHGRGGNDQTRSSGSSSRRQTSQASQQRRQTTPGYPSLNAPPESPQGYPPPLYATANVQYPPPRSAYPGQYMMSPPPPLNMAHTPPSPFPYPPAFHVPEQPQSIHAGYPTIAIMPMPNIPPTRPSTRPPSPRRPVLAAAIPCLPPLFRYSSPMSPAYPPYPQQSPSFSSPAPMYPHPHQQQHQHQHQQHVYPAAGAYPAQYPHSPGGAQEGDGGTWWYVPSQPPSSYPGPFYPQQQQQPAPLSDSGGDHLGPGSLPASPTYARARPSTPSSSSAPPSSPVQRERPIVRRAYHPNPPAHRSEWVMWAGNVPSDAVHDELWRFLTQPPDDSGGSSSASVSSDNSGVDGVVPGGGGNRSGVLSIFLISRSSCAFVNYETEAHLQAAIARFNGVPLRAADPRCARLRGMGMHTRWVKAKEKAARERGGDDSASASSNASTSDPGTPSSGEPSLAALSIHSSDDEHHRGAVSRERPQLRPHQAGGGSNSSGSYTSTNSSLLREHFPQRFFILKSLTRDDLDLSVQTGVWATQKHNEPVLDRAFRTSKDVFLVFSVNKSGEFYGYARMAGPVGQGEGGRVTWARRDSTAGSPTTRGPAATTSQPVPPHDTSSVHQVHQGHAAPHQLLSVDRLVDGSPQPFPTPSSTPPRPPDVHSAPAVLGPPHRNISADSLGVLKGASLDQGAMVAAATSAARGGSFELDEGALVRAMRPGAPEAGGSGSRSQSGEGHAHVHERMPSMGSASAVPGLGSVAEEGEKEDAASAAAGTEGGGGAPREEGWGQDFKLQWLCTERLPFLRTRHIRNPWNHDREVKVSRDGTELEPAVGQALLEEWRLFLVSEGTGQHTPLGDGGVSGSVFGPPAAAARTSRGAGGGSGTSSRS